ncbi:hypothetical protein [Streptomyces rhizosphaerihabitans]|uniref:hypothetical protein n=1 Tax=Streptomyces rhizosphaerihabitans TaxID=1266770 RepID=UPI0021C14AC4|nr:hypothetical protein [Streptomyces rhizosphaerihabitans]MCT9003670.1 hypothetical protein [Streptomyces rhizosphaerihabitans]
MSASTLTSPLRRALPGPRGLVWTVLRLHRTALWIWTGFVVLAAGLLLWLYGPGAAHTQHLLDTFGYAGVQEDAWTAGTIGSPFSGAYNDLFYDPASLLNIASFAVAVFAGGSLIARELENGTARLAWTQSVTPARWLAAKLAVPALFITVGTGLLVALYRMLWSAHSNLLLAGIGPRALYFSVGPATVAAPLLGLAVGVLAGLVLRRTLPALAVAGIAQSAVIAFRANSWPFQGSYQQPELSVRSRAITSTGARIPDPGCYESRACLARHDVVGFTREYLPSPDYWPRQLLETGVLLAAAAILVAVAFGVLRRTSTS